MSASEHGAVEQSSVKVTMLGNGMMVITKEVRSAPVVSFWVWYRVGGRNEVTGITGVSHWAEHMMFKGTEKLKKGDIMRLLSKNGASYNATTWVDYTNYFETLPSDRYELALQIESDRMVNSRFEAEDVASERSVIISEREGGENFPGRILNEEVTALAYKVHPYHHGTIGWKSDLRVITREDLYKHYKTFYTPNNAFIVAVGDFDTAEMVGKITEYFGSIPSGEEPPTVRGVEPEQDGERRAYIERPGQAAYIEIAYHAVEASHPDMPALAVLESVLSGAGGGFGRSARMYKALVDSQLAVSAGADFTLNRDPGLFEFSAMARDGVALEQIEQAIDAVIQQVTDEPISEAELRRVIKQTKAQFVYSADSVSNQGYLLGYFEIVANDHTLADRFPSLLEQVTPEDVQRVAGQYLKKSNRTVGHFIPRPMTDEDSHKMAVAQAAAAGGHGHFYTPISELVPSDRLAFYHQPAPASLFPAEDAQELVFLSAQAATAQEQALARLDDDKIVRKVLPNGITALIYTKKDNPSVIVRAALRAGSIYETPEQAGLAGFTSSILRRGTEQYSFSELNELTDELAFSVESGSSRHLASVGGRSLREDFGTLVEVMGEMLQHATFPEQEIEKVRGNVLTGLKERENDTRGVAERKFHELAYPKGHPYHYSSSGYIETVEKISREDMVAFYKRYYRPDTTTIVIVGDIEAADALAKLQAELGGWQPDPSAGEAPSIEVTEVSKPASITREVSEVPGKTQADIVLGFPSLPRKHPDYEALMMGNYILGQLGLYGRLGQNVRDKQGLAYYCYSSLEGGFGNGSWAIRAGVNPANIEKAIAGMLEETNRILTDAPIEAEELEETKSFLTGTLPLRLETSSGIAAQLMDIELYELGSDYVQRYLQKVQAMTTEEIMAALHKHINLDSYVLAIAGTLTNE